MIDSICDEFELGWRKSAPTSIESCLKRVPSHEQSRLLDELLQVELWWYGREVGSPRQEDYLDRFPDFTDTVRSAFDKVELVSCTSAKSSFATRVNAKLSFSTRVNSNADETIVPDVPEVFSGLKRFKILELLGKGSFGAVWKAHDSQLGRIVALKSPHGSKLDDDFRERFIRESRAAARLQHDGLVSVYDVCLSERNHPVIVSQFIDGMSLADLQEQHGLFACEEAAAMCADLSDALLHAHLEGVVHRDLKPANILVDSSGKAYVTDFGLAKDIQNESAVTHEGDVLGTVAYMAPEQASGFGCQADCRSDIYAIGVILYEMVTGERPFRGTMHAMLRQVINDLPPSPQKLNSLVSNDLQTIILKCLEKQPEHRYKNAADLRDDLVRYVNNEAIVARPPNQLERFMKWYPWHATEMLGMYFVVAAMTWVFFILGGLLETPTTEGFQLSYLGFLPWAITWIFVGAMIIKQGFWFEIANVPLLLAFMWLPKLLNDRPQSIALIGLISFFGLVLQIGALVSRISQRGRIGSGNLSSRLSSLSGSRERHR